MRADRGGMGDALQGNPSTSGLLAPLIVHVVYRFDTGGLENGVVNLINNLPREAYRHAIVALTDVAPAFRQRIFSEEVQFIALHKPPGQGVWLYPRLWRLFRRLRPSIVHTRNLAALECQIPAWLAGVPGRVHSEHGRDLIELSGGSKRYRTLRRMYRPFVQQYLAVSRDLEDYLIREVGLPRQRISQIYNGVDSVKFAPSRPRQAIPGCPFTGSNHWLVGTVGRMQAIKAQTLLAQAFIRVLELFPALNGRMRLVMVGEGPLRAESQALLDAAGVGHLAWLPGERTDVSKVMQGLDCFVLPSLSEGTSNTILEAMSCGLPVIATDVGGNRDLVLAGRTGVLIPAADVEAMANSIAHLAVHADRATGMGREGRSIVEQSFSLPAMVSAYRELYDRVLSERMKTA